MSAAGQQCSDSKRKADGLLHEDQPPSKQQAVPADDPLEVVADALAARTSSGRASSLPAAAAAAVAAAPATPNDVAAVRIAAAYSEDQGARPAMEDVAVLQLDARPAANGDAQWHQGEAGGGLVNVRCCFAAVFDGHGGSNVAQLAAQILHQHVLAAGLQEVLDKVPTSSGGGAPDAVGAAVGAAPPSPAAKVDVKGSKAAITKGFASADAVILQRCATDKWVDGACAACAWVVADTVLVANVGDARAVLARTADKDVGSVKAGQPRALTLSKEHLAIFAQERARIEKAGGYVSADGRLNGRMQVARSFGDAQLKQVGCSCVPDVAAFELTPRDQFLLLGCDGFWTAWDPQGAVDAAAGLLAGGGGSATPKAVTNRLLNVAMRERSCKDNCTVMLLQFVRASAQATS